MAYIGNIPAEKYTNLAVQHFTVSATTGYTLTHSVTNENGIALFINNVRQQPGSSYAYTAVGTTLTLSAATAGTDTMYCVYLGKAVGTISPPDGSVNSAKIVDGSITNDDLAGSISSAKITSLDATKLTGDVDIARLPAAVLNSNVPATDTSTLEYNQAILAFKIASANQLAKFQMVDQIIDEYQDATGVDAGNSTNEIIGGSGTAKYFEGGSSVTPTTSSVGSVASTGTVDGDYTYYKWTTVASNHSFTTDTAQDYEYLVVAGGGGGAGWGGGGGGAGGYRAATGFAVAATTISGITVGAGGTGSSASAYGAPAADATAGSDSIFSTITSTGGGYGGNDSPSGIGGNGGSGGGRGVNGGSGAEGDGNTPSTSPSQGNDGGLSENGSPYLGGGGGGFGGAGGDATSDTAGLGGVGTSNDITGASVDYAGGGGGGEVLGSAHATATHGGGNGGLGSSPLAVDGVANTGGGGGGAGATSSGGTSQTGGGDGGSGVVIIRRLTTATVVGGNLTLQSVATTAESAPTTADLVILIEDAIAGAGGIAAINTDIKAKVSRDGTDFGDSYVTLEDQGDWAGTSKRIFVARNIDLTATHDTGTAMKYKIETFNQSAGVKETRIHATSLAWA